MNGNRSRAMLYFLQNHRGNGWQIAWNTTYHKYRNDLSHYFRFLYQLYRFIEINGGAQSYFYARIVRASLSEAELVLLALNCAYGEGNPKFRQLLHKYSLLNNISEGARIEFSLDEKFEKQAFDRETIASS